MSEPPALPRDAAEMVREATTLQQKGQFAAAAVLYRSVLERDPRQADLLHCLGLCEIQLGHPDIACKLLAESIALDDRNAVVYVDLGRACIDDGNPDGALEHLQRALALAPDDWEARHLAGRALLAADQPFEAVAVLEHAETLHPNHTALTLDLAHAYASCYRHPAAIVLFRKLLARDARNLEALGGVATSLYAISRADEALQCLRRATALAPSEFRWQCELGNLLAELGRLDEAARLFRDMLRRKPGYPLALAYLIALRPEPGDAVLVKRALDHLAGEEIRRPVRVRLEFALGKHFDAIQDYDQAFTHYQSANQVMAEDFRYRPLAVEAQVDRLIAVCDRAFFESRRGLGNPSARPLFIVGMPRSGTTLTEQIVASHPDIAGAGELGYFNHLAYVLARNAGDEEGRANYLRDLSPDAVTRCAFGYLAQLDEVSEGARRVVDKMPMNFMQLGLIALTFPSARIVHCRRDPLDNCLSCYFENVQESQNYSTKLESVGHYYRQYDRLMRHWNEVLPLPILEVSYEDTVADSARQARRLMEFCGVPWHERCLQFQRIDRAANTPSRWQAGEPVGGESLARWRRYERHIGPLREALAHGT